MPEMHLKQPAFTYSACGPFTKNEERIQKFKETRLGEVWFEHNIAYRDFKDVAKKQLQIKFKEIKHLILLKIQNMMDIKEVSLLWLMNTLRKKLSSSGIKPMPNSVLWT